jgi:hypothetical protein
VNAGSLLCGPWGPPPGFLFSPRFEGSRCILGRHTRPTLGKIPGIIRLLLLVPGVPSMRLDDGFTTHPLSLGHSDPLHGLARGPASKV